MTPFRLYNTLTKQIENFVPADPRAVTFYTCGPTVYDDAHIGNFRSFLAADLLRRWIESPLCTLQGLDGALHDGPRRVTHVMNITDVGHMTDDADADGGGEDKMVAAAKRIVEAKKSGKIPTNASVDPDDPFAVAEFYRGRFLEDARALGLKLAVEAADDPTLMPRATGHIEGMKSVIVRLLDEGAAYAAGKPGSRAVYFRVQAAEQYGRLSGNTLDKLRGGAGGRVDASNQQEKQHPADFLLWKEDHTHKMKWPSPNHPMLAGWGDGYPGWHIECTAMALERLVPGGLAKAQRAQIDLHSGGEDNIFPHHECEIAQSCAFTHAPNFARHWFHPRFLMVDGAKMSKSKGTFFTPRELIAKGFDPAAIRLELIKTHYRANADFSLQGLKDSARTVERWRQFAAVGRAGGAGETHSLTRDAVGHAMSDDLNIAGAIGAVNSWINATASPTLADAALFDQFDGIFGVASLKPLEQQSTGIAVYLPGTTPSDEVETLLAQRRDAKKAKDFAASDAIRDRLKAMGYAIKDMPGGKVEVAPG